MALATGEVVQDRQIGVAVERTRSAAVRQLLTLIEAEFQESAWRAFRAVMLEGESPRAAAARRHMSVNAVLLAKSRVLARLHEESAGLVDPA